MRWPIRPLDAGDLPSVLPLAAAAVPALRLTAGDLERNIFETGSDRDLRVVAEAEEGLAGVACAVVRPVTGAPDGRGTGYIKLLVVADALRGRGIGTALLSRVEDVLRERGVTRVLLDGAAPIYLQPGLPSSAGDARAFFRARGYRETDSRKSILASLDALDVDTGPSERALAPRGVTFRRARAEDVPSFGPVIRSAFSPDWAEEFSASVELPESTAELALSGTELAGFAVAGLWARNAFGPMGTVERLQGAGIGTVLLKRCLAELRRRGERDAVISWLGPESFYRRCLGGETTPLVYAVLEKSLAPVT